MPPEQKSNGALIGSIVVIVILIIGGIYFWKHSVENKEAPEPQVQNSAASLDAELNNVNLDSLDSGI
ncbi:MAG: hypothetical protein ABIS26_02195 [Candidatus Paceibacterota bacterium]